MSSPVRGALRAVAAIVAAGCADLAMGPCGVPAATENRTPGRSDHRRRPAGSGGGLEITVGDRLPGGVR